MTERVIEQLAEAAHDVWMEGRLRAGWTHGPVYDRAAKRNPSLIPYGALTVADQQSDRDLVLGIPAILAKAGYRMSRARSSKHGRT